MSPGNTLRSPLTLANCVFTRWQVMQVTPSRATAERSHSGSSRGSSSWVPICWWQRTQKVPMVPEAKSLMACSNLWNIGEIDA